VCVCVCVCVLVNIVLNKCVHGKKTMVDICVRIPTYQLIRSHIAMLQLN